MLKKNNLVILVSSLLFISLFVYFAQGSLTGITGLAVQDFEVSLTNKEVRVGEDLNGMLILNFTEPFSPTTKVKTKFNDVSSQIILKDYFKAVLKALYSMPLNDFCLTMTHRKTKMHGQRNI